MTPSVKPQRHRDTESSQRRNHKDTKTRSRHEDIARSNHRGAETQSHRRGKPQSHRTGVSRPTGRAATARSRGIEARWTDHHVQARVDRIHLRLGSCLRHAPPASIVWTTPKPSPTVTLSERVRRPSRRVPTGLEPRRFPHFRSDLRGILRLAPLAQNDRFSGLLSFLVLSARRALGCSG